MKYPTLHAEQKSETMEYLISLACSLITFAEKDSVFRNELLELTTHLEETGVEALPVKKNMGIILPKDIETARRRALWLLHNESLKTEPALETLAVWRKKYADPQPKAVVLGVKIGVLPIGIAGKMKLEETMPIVMRNDVYQMRDTKITQKTVATSMSVLEKSLKRVDYNMRNLEPEILEWFLGGKETKIFTGGKNEIKKVIHEITGAHVVHETYEDKHGIAVVAMSPLVQDAFLELECGLTSQK